MRTLTHTLTYSVCGKVQRGDVKRLLLRRGKLSLSLSLSLSHTHTHTQTQTQAHTHVHTHKHMHTQTHTHTHTNTHTHTHIHTHIHTHTKHAHTQASSLARAERTRLEMRQDLKGKVSGWISQFRSQQAGEAAARGGGGRGREGERRDPGEVGAKGRVTPAKDPYNITAKQPCSSAKEHHSSSKEPSISGSSEDMPAHLCSVSALLSSAQFRAEAVRRGEATEDRDGARNKRREAREEKNGTENFLSFASSTTHSPSITRTHTLLDSPTQTHLAYPVHSPVLAGNARHAENTVTVGVSSSSHYDSPCKRDGGGHGKDW